MPYPAHPVDQIQHAAAEYLTAKTRFETNKNVLKAGGLKKAMDGLGKTFAQQLETDIAGVRHNAVEHFNKIDAWLGNAASALSRAKEAHARWLREPNEHDAEAVLAAAPLCERLANEASVDAAEFGQSWFAMRGYNCRDADPKYFAGFYKTRLGIMEEGKGFTMKVAKISAIYHEALALKNLQLAKMHEQKRGIVQMQVAAEEMFRSLEHMFATSFTGLKTVQNAAGNCETIRDWSHNPRLKKDGDLKQIDSLFINLSNLRKGYVQALDAMNKTFGTAVKQFDEEDLKDPEIRGYVSRSRALIDDTRQKLQFVENGYKNAMSDMAKIRSVLKK